MASWCRLAKALIQAITVEIAQLDLLFATYADLLAHVQQQAPDVVELAALATVLHSFYNGTESMFLAVARQVDQHVPDAPRWHRTLLAQMVRPGTVRPALITAPLEARLLDYLAFRHYFRHAYAFTLDWARLQPLVLVLPSVYAALRDELTTFLQFLAAQPESE